MIEKLSNTGINYTVTKYRETENEGKFTRSADGVCCVFASMKDF